MHTFALSFLFLFFSLGGNLLAANSPVPVGQSYCRILVKPGPSSPTICGEAGTLSNPGEPSKFTIFSTLECAYHTQSGGFFSVKFPNGEGSPGTCYQYYDRTLESLGFHKNTSSGITYYDYDCVEYQYSPVLDLLDKDFEYDPNRHPWQESTGGGSYEPYKYGYGTASINHEYGDDGNHVASIHGYSFKSPSGSSETYLGSGKIQQTIELCTGVTYELTYMDGDYVAERHRSVWSRMKLNIIVNGKVVRRKKMKTGRLARRAPIYFTVGEDDPKRAAKTVTIEFSLPIPRDERLAFEPASAQEYIDDITLVSVYRASIPDSANVVVI